MTRLELEIYFEHPIDNDYAKGVAAGFSEAVGRLAPQVSIVVSVRAASEVSCGNSNQMGKQYEWSTTRRAPGAQKLLITERDLGAQGWGGAGVAVVSTSRMERKRRDGGDPIDIVVHECIHSNAAS